MRVKSLLILVSAVSFCASLASAQTSEEVLAQAIKAAGGEAALKAVHTIKVTGKLVLEQYGIEAPLVIYAKRQNKVKFEIDIQGQKVITATDGTTAWRLNPFQGITEPTPMEGPEAEEFIMGSDFDLPLFGMERLGIKVEFISGEEIDGKAMNHLKYTFPNGDEREFYFDANTGLLLQVSAVVEDAAQGKIDVKTHFSDYRDVDGLMMHFHRKRIVGNNTEIMVFETRELNQEIDDSVFAFPKPGEKEK
jgi:outer membrane lipoprotein-sorting protein